MRHFRTAALSAALSIAALATTATAQSVSLYAENFESLVLGPIVTFDTELRSPSAWTETPPTGWTVDDSGILSAGDPLNGVTEFEGWSFVSRDWWIATAGDQRRSEFVGGSGIIAVADPDEWDDFGNPTAPFDAKLRTPFINLAGAPSGQDIKVSFNSSWRPEVNQKATLTATFNDGANTQIELLRYESPTTSPFYKADTPNELVVIPLTNQTGSGGSNLSVPAGATQMQLEFRLFDAGNNWWWAFDNFQVYTGANPPGIGALRVEIDRDSGAVQLINDSGNAINIRGYSIVSNAGVFNEAAADFLAPANDWLRATNYADASNDLSEVNLTADTIAAGETIDLGDVWRPYYTDAGDVSFEYLLAGSDDPIAGQVTFVGNGDKSYEFLDLNYDGAIDIADWETFKSGFGKSLTGLTQAQRYTLSDLDNDKRHTAADFQLFQRNFDQANGAGAFAAILAVPEPGACLLGMLAGAGLLMVRRRAVLTILAAISLASLGSDASAQLTVYYEDFDGSNATVTLGPFQEEDFDGQEVWTNTLPGWTFDNSALPGIGNPDTDGVVDWAGWAIVDKNTWIPAAGDQGRSAFTRGVGNVMVADPDEWDDADGTLRNPIARTPNPDKLYNVFGTTPVINIPAGIPAGRLTLSFDSSWRGDEFQDDLDGQNNQTALIKASYNGGAKQEVFRRESNPDSNTYNPYQENERISQINLLYDGTATTVQLEFGMTQAWNDWWWAIDNLQIAVFPKDLKLRVNTFNGQAFLEGDDTINQAINFLSIESDNGVLTALSATGLSGAGLPGVDGPDAGNAAGNSSGERWEKLVNAETASKLFSEAFLFGSSTFDDTVSINLGRMMDPTAPVGQRDLRFSYALTTGDIVEVGPEFVEYFYDDTVGLAGDFNGNGVVDAADYTVWRDNVGGAYTPADYQVWKANYGATSVAYSAAQGVPEPTTLLLLAIGLVATLRAPLRKLRPTAVVASVAAVAALGGERADAYTLDRLYSFGDEPREMAVAGARVGSVVPGTIDSIGNLTPAGQPSLRQVINMAGAGPSAFAQPKYVAVNDRPDMLSAANNQVAPGLGVSLNDSPIGSTFNRQYLHTGFGEALNWPQFSPTSTFATPAGSLNYDLISDRGFELWTKPLSVSGEAHIVMDSNQHGVLINSAGQFAMRYAYDQEVIDRLATDSGQPASAFANVFDYSSGVTAVANQWYHLSVVRPFGPSNGSIFYLNGIAVAAAKGAYNVELVQNDDNGVPNLDKWDSSPLVVGANTGNPSFGTGNYYRGVVDDLEMFFMGINSAGYYGEYVFERDNGYAQAYAPTTPGDLNGDDAVTLADAQLFANNWRYVQRLEWTDFSGAEQSLVVGDLGTRARGDFNYDGVVNLADWAVLNNANPTMAALAMRAINGYSIPEPTSFGLAALAVAALWLSGASGNRRAA